MNKKRKNILEGLSVDEYLALAKILFGENVKYDYALAFEQMYGVNVKSKAEGE